MTTIEVTWPSGATETLPAVARRPVADDQEGKGDRARPSAARVTTRGEPASRRRPRRARSQLAGRASAADPRRRPRGRLPREQLGVALLEQFDLRRRRRRRSARRSQIDPALAHRAAEPRHRAASTAASLDAARTAREAAATALPDRAAARLRARPDRAGRGPRRRCDARVRARACSCDPPTRRRRSTSGSSTCRSAGIRGRSTLFGRRSTPSRYNATAAYGLGHRAHRSGPQTKGARRWSASRSCARAATR